MPFSASANICETIHSLPAPKHQCDEESLMHFRTYINISKAHFQLNFKTCLLARCLPKGKPARGYVRTKNRPISQSIDRRSPTGLEHCCSVVLPGLLGCRMCHIPVVPWHLKSCLPWRRGKSCEMLLTANS